MVATVTDMYCTVRRLSFLLDFHS